MRINLSIDHRRPRPAGPRLVAPNDVLHHAINLSVLCCRPSCPASNPTSTPSTASPFFRTDLGSSAAHRLVETPAGAATDRRNV